MNKEKSIKWIKNIICPYCGGDIDYLYYSGTKENTMFLCPLCHKNFKSDEFESPDVLKHLYIEK